MSKSKVEIKITADGIFVNGQEVKGYKFFKDQYKREVLVTCKTDNSARWINQGRIIAWDAERNEILKADSNSAGWCKLGPNIKCEIVSEEDID